MGELTITSENLPKASDEELAQYVLISDAQAQYMRSAMATLKAKADAEPKLFADIYKQRLHESQIHAEFFLDAQVEMGKRLNNMKKASGQRTDLQPIDTHVDRLPKPKSEQIKDLGFTQKQVERLQMIARPEHKDIIDKAKAEAKANDDIVSRSLVLNMIKQEKAEQQKQEREADTEFSVPGFASLGRQSMLYKYK